MQKTVPGLHKQNPLVFYLRTLFYVLIALLLRIVTFAPLLVFFVPSDLPFWPWLSLLCPVLFFFFLLPLRFSFAEALVQNNGTRHFAFDTAFSLRQYGEKLWRSLVHVLSVLKWCIPLAAAGFLAFLQKDSGASAIMDQLIRLGVWAGNLASGVGTFLRGLFGETTPLQIQGGLAEGLQTLGIILALLLLVIAIGSMRNSATRYVWAYASQNHRNPSTENRRRVTNRRWTQLGFSIVNLALWAPLLIALSRIFLDVVSEVSTQLMLLGSGLPMDMSFLGPKIGQLAFAFFVLYLPFLPLRRMITAFFAAKSIRFVQPSPLGAPAQPSPEPADPAQAPAPVSGADLLQEEEAEEGLPSVSPSTPVPEPVPAWPAQKDPAKYTPYTPYQPPMEEGDQEGLREAPSLWTPPSQEEPVAAEPADLSTETPVEEAAETAGTTAQAAPEAVPSQEAEAPYPPIPQPRQDVDPSAFTIGQ